MFPFDNPVFYPMPAWSAVRISGADATSFLHGQFTSDVAALSPGVAQWSAWCSPKGRVLATFALLRSAPPAQDGYLIVLPSDVAPAIIKRLRMFILRAKVVVEPLGDTHRVLGTTASRPALAGANVEAELLEMPEGRCLVVGPTGTMALVEEALAESALPAEAVAGEQLGIRAGVPCITQQTQELFVPQMLNLELIGGVSFQKGCYPGQEIVARMHYLGRLKERLHRAHVDIRQVATRVPLPGDSLYGTTFGSQACGTVVNVAPSPDGEGYDMLAVVQVASAAGDTIRIAVEPDAPTIRIDPLPYSVPPPREAR